MTTRQSIIKKYQPQSLLFRTLTHPARLAILDLLREGEACVCHLEAHLGYRQAYLSQQLAVLRQADLVQVRKEGWNVYYRVTDAHIYAIIDTAGQVVKGDQNLQPQKKTVCPCPKCTQKLAE